MNYFNLRLLQDNDVDESVRIDNSLKKIKKEMKMKGYAVDDFFEVTQLINSMIGLLIFPQQAYYNNLSEKTEDMKREYPLLYSYVIGQRGEYQNTYYENTRNQRIRTPEKNNIKNVLRHLRNSASHRRLSIHPENGRLCDGANIIKAVKFEDSRGTEKFLLKIDVKDLEQLLIEICDGIIKKTN